MENSEYLCTQIKRNTAMATTNKKKISIDDLIKLLESEVAKGATHVIYSGTIVAPQNGNSVVITTDPQI